MRMPPHNSVCSQSHYFWLLFCQAFHYKLDVLFSTFQVISTGTDLVELKEPQKDVGLWVSVWWVLINIDIIVIHFKHTLTSKLKVRQTERQRDRFDTFYRCQGSLSEVLSEHFVRHNHTHQRTMRSLCICLENLYQVYSENCTKYPSFQLIPVDYQVYWLWHTCVSIYSLGARPRRAAWVARAGVGHVHVAGLAWPAWPAGWLADWRRAMRRVQRLTHT